MAQITQARVTAEEYFKLPETNQRVELLDGEIVTQMPPKHIHQRLVGLLYHLLLRLIQSGEIVLSPSAIHLDDENVPEPDLFWVSGSDSLCKLGEDDFWHGAPDLIVEVLLPSTARYDKDYKFKLYQKYGVREYWIVDPVHQYIEVFSLENKKFKQLGVYQADHSFESPVLNNQKVELQTLFAAQSR
jgi:Uma2 family endonuclease